MLPVADYNYQTSPWVYESRSFAVGGNGASLFGTISNSLYSGYSNKATQLVQQAPKFLVIVDGQPFYIKLKDDHQSDQSQNIPTTQPVVLADRLDLIKNRLALSITQMSELFGVTRKTIYDWYEGKNHQRRSTASRMEILIEVLDTSSEDVDLQRLKTVWNIAVTGKSFREIFCDDQLEDASLRQALQEKLSELSSRMVATSISTWKTTTQIGEAHLAEFDRSADFD